MRDNHILTRVTNVVKARLVLHDDRTLLLEAPHQLLLGFYYLFSGAALNILDDEGLFERFFALYFFNQLAFNFTDIRGQHPHQLGRSLFGALLDALGLLDRRSPCNHWDNFWFLVMNQGSSPHYLS